MPSLRESLAATYRRHHGGDVDSVDRGQFAVRHLISKRQSALSLANCAVIWQTDVTADAYHLLVLIDGHPTHILSFAREQPVRPLWLDVHRAIN